MIASQAVIVLQARMASRRLPGKAQRLVAGRTVLTRCLARLLDGGAAPVVLATTTNAEDDALAVEAEHLGVQVFRGSEEDVLERFVLVAAQTGARHVIRATADNPAVDIDAAGRVLRVLAHSAADYVVEHGLPHGAAVEGVSADALRRSHELTQRADDREHVTTFVKRERELFRVVELDAPAHLQRPDLSLTVDAPQDLRFMEAVLSRVPQSPEEAPLRLIIDAADDVLRREAVA